MADTIKCPNCSANLLFDADTQKLTCDFCGGSFAPDDKRITDIAEKLFKDDSHNESSIVEEEGVAQSEAMRGMADEPEIEYNLENMHELTCNACGATVVADNNTTASYCAFCGSPAIVSQRLSSEFTPKYIIPFAMGKDRAKESFLKWCKGGRFAPFGFASDKNIEKLTGLYVPFWLFDLDGEMDIEAAAETVKSVTVGNTTTTTTTYYEVSRHGTYKWKNIPLDGSTRIDDKLMEAIEPYDYKDLKIYNPAYLPGFFADKYDQTPEDLKARIIQRGNEYLDEEFRSSTAKYQRVRIKKEENRLGDYTADYALLPVWFMHYKYLGKDYDFAMNGQTGEVAGVAPISPVKRFVFFCLVAAILSVVARIITAFILGGIAG